MNRDWLEEYTLFIGATYAPDDTAAALRSSVIAGALVGGTDSALTHWFMNPDVSLVALTELALESVASLWSGADQSPRNPS